MTDCKQGTCPEEFQAMRKIQRSEERKVKLVFSTIAFILSGVFAGCASAPEPGLEAARRMILDGRAECVLVKDGRIRRRRAAAASARCWPSTKPGKTIWPMP